MDGQISLSGVMGSARTRLPVALKTALEMAGTDAALGADRTDEDTFRALPWSAWMVKVGEASTSRARFSVDSPAAVRAALRALVAEG